MLRRARSGLHALAGPVMVQAQYESNVWHKPKSNDFMRGKNRWKIRNVDPKSCDVPAGRHRKTVKLKYCRHKEGWTPLVYLGRCLLPRSLFGRGLGAGMMQRGSSIIGWFRHVAFSLAFVLNFWRVHKRFAREMGRLRACKFDFIYFVRGKAQAMVTRAMLSANYPGP